MKKSNKSLFIFILVIFSIVILSFSAIMFLNEKAGATKEQVGSNLFGTDPIGDSELIVFLGEASAPNEVLLTFDYLCPYCHIWIEDIFPALKPDIENGTVKFRAQSLVFLGETSHRLSNFDQNLKRYYPQDYYTIFFDIITNANEEDWGTETYLHHVIEKYGLEQEKVLSIPKLDEILITQKYAQTLDVEYVPTIYVNGQKVEDSFSIEEIRSYYKY